MAGRVVSGGSTLTMQTARILEPRPRNIGSKLVEIARAWQLERRLTKDEILSLYLSLTPYGGNLEGVRAASWSYFGHEADKLSKDEIALLIRITSYNVCYTKLLRVITCGKPYMSLAK